MRDSSKTNQYLIAKISALKKRNQELEYSEAESKRTEQEMTILSDIGRLIDSTLDIHEVYEQFAAVAKKLIRFVQKPLIDTINADSCAHWRSFTH